MKPAKSYLEPSLDQFVHWDDFVHIDRLEGILKNFEVVDVLVF